MNYKGFNKDLKCRGFQFEVGKEYEQDGEVSACRKGFHACEYPLDVFNYYPPSTSRYCVVEQSGKMDKDGDDSKVASQRIKIGAEIGVAGLAKAAIEYVKEHTTTENTDPKKATAGDFGAATAGNYGAATAGYKGAATAGYKGAATAGDYGAATAGDYGAATAGYKGAATAGDKGAATSRGSVSVGENGSGLVRGNNVKAKGGMGAVLVLVEENEGDFGIAHWKAIVVDGKNIMPDTWYVLENGEIKEA